MRKQAIHAPEWFRTGAIYQINPRTFSEEGTISSITKELPFLKDLGFSTMYLCPIFKEDDSTELKNWSERQKKSQTNNPKNPYRMMDYYAIDEEYGTMEDLKTFTGKCHELGMRVMLDLVYFHIGPNADILKIHPEFAQHNEDGTVKETIWHFPYLNFESEGLREYLYGNMVYYVGVCDVDGFRCDVGDGVPLDFWEEGRKRIRRIKPDAVLLNEGRKPEYVEKAFDACYAFDWHESVYALFTGEMTVDEVVTQEQKNSADFPEGALLMRDIDNHDTVTDWPCRAETAAGHRGMDLIQVINFTMDGIPMVYTGDELADEMQLNMFANRFFPGRFHATDRSIKNQEESLHRQNLIRTLNALRKDCPVLSGFTPAQFVGNDQEKAVMSFLRADEKEEIAVLGNFSKENVTVKLDKPVLLGQVILSENAGIADASTAQIGAYGYLIIKNR